MRFSDPDKIERFHDDGYLVVHGLYSHEEMADWKCRIIDLLKQQRRIDEPTGVVVWMAPVLDLFFRTQMVEPRVVSVLQSLIGPNLEFLSVKPVFKNATTTFASPWHQDWFYWKGSHKISVWIALDPAREENGCLKVIPGSHRAVREMTRVKEETGFELRVNIDDVEKSAEQTLIVDRGDAVFFHDLLLHASHPNISGKDRWSLISTYRNASIEDDSTVWKAPILASGYSVNGASTLEHV